jgi:isoleucyl-tRNA synthetase
MDGIDLAEITITSASTLVEGAPPKAAFALDDVADIGVVAGLAEGEKCARCWRVLPEVGGDPGHPDLCRRCTDAVAAAPAAGAG